MRKGFAAAAIVLLPAFGLAEAVPGEFIVKLQTKTTLSDLGRSLSVKAERYIDHDQTLALVKTHRRLAELRQTARARDSRVEFIEPNFIYRAHVVPNDPRFEELWGLKSKENNGIDIAAEKAWDLTTGSATVVVAVTDTGIAYKNAELKDNVWVNTKEQTGKAGVDDDGNGFIDDVHGFDFYNNDGDPADDHGHGTHVAGTIGAAGDNRTGIVGVAWKVRLMGLKFLGAGGGGSTEDAIKAVQYAVDNGARIINASWGGGDYSRALEETIKKAQDRGVLFVASAGNSGYNTDKTPAYPSCYDLENIISVAAVTNRGTLAYFSNYGKLTVDVGAPGLDILSLNLTGFEAMSGTSMAAPHVTGVAALLLSREPGLGIPELRKRLLATTKSLPELRGKTASGGMVNAYNTLTNQYDPDDPKRWPAVAFSAKSQSPYSPDSNEKLIVTAPAGTRAFSIHFSKFETEDGYDVVKIFDSAGELVWKASGERHDEFSPVINGASATVVLTSDAGNQKQGFEIDRLALKP